MQVGRGTDDNGVDVIGGGDGFQIPDLTAALFRHLGGGSLHRIEHGSKDGLIVAVDSTSMDLADTAGTEDGETNGHGGTLREAVSD